MKFNFSILLHQLGNIFLYCPLDRAMRRINSSNIDLSVRINLELLLRMSVLWLKSRNPSGFALRISLTLKLYFIVYPSSRHDTGTVNIWQSILTVSVRQSKYDSQYMTVYIWQSIFSVSIRHLKITKLRSSWPDPS